MSGLLGLVRIEARRSAGLWLFIPLILIAGWLARDSLPVRVWLWPDTSFAIRQTINILGPLAAGVAAWMAGRDRLRKIGDLLATMPCPAPARNLATWAGTALWTAGAYAMPGIILLSLTAWFATGGSPLPYLPIIAVGVLAIIAQTAFGYLAGHYLPSRFVAPLVAVLLFVAQAAPNYSSSASISDLSPVLNYLDGDVFYGLRQDLSLPQAAWLLGLTGTALALIALRSRRTWPVWSALAAAITVATISAGALLTTQPAESANQALIPYEPVCVDGTITVCVHPAYQRMLPETVDIINRMAQPLAGIPGVPTRAEQRTSADAQPGKSDPPEGAIVFGLEDPAKIGWGYQMLTRDIARDLVADLHTVDMASFTGMFSNIATTDSDTLGIEAITLPSGMSPAQFVVAEWLLVQVWDDVCEEVSPSNFQCWGWEASVSSEGKAARERLTALDPAVRRAWFEEHYTALRAGELTLADLP